MNNNNSNQRRNIKFNTPTHTSFNSAVKTKVGRAYLQIWYTNTTNNSWDKIFNRNSVKFSYSCTENMLQLIKKKNKSPDNGEWLTENLIYPMTKSVMFCELDFVRQVEETRDGHMLLIVAVNLYWLSEIKNVVCLLRNREHNPTSKTENECNMSYLTPLKDHGNANFILIKLPLKKDAMPAVRH